jgi:hypothetical protein
MLPLPTACAVLLAVHCAQSVVTDLSPTCAKSCKCLGPWARCISGKIQDLGGHFGPQIETISLQFFNIGAIEANAFSDFRLPNLWKLDIVHCGVVTIKKNAFSGLQDLLSLHLDNNEIEIIEPGAFFGVFKLNSLSFQHNKIKSLEYGVFGGLDNLNLLNLNNNLLKSLKPKIFERVQTLTTIFLKDNLIESINYSALEGLNEAVQIYVDNNPLVCNCALKKEWSVLRDRIVGATCRSPRNLAGRGWDVLQGVNCDYSEDK